MDLLQWRKAKKLTAQEAADKFGVSQPTITRIERGDLFPAAKTVAVFIERSSGEISADDLQASWQAAREKRAASA